MKLEIYGNMEKKTTNKAVVFFSSILGINIPYLEIYTFEGGLENGSCHQNSQDEYCIFLKEREFGHMLVTLAHELTHVKQYIKDNLAECYETVTPYNDRWWEREAFEMESFLAQKMIEKVKE